MHELPLMAFTLLLQASVGMTLWLAFLHRHILITSSAPRLCGRHYCWLFWQVP